MKALREVRERNGISQRELAIAISMSQGAISFYENNNRKLPFPIAKKIAKILNVKWYELYDDDMEDDEE